MKAVAQRVSQASVTIENETTASIDQGLLILLGIHKEDTDADIEWIVRKIANLRIFEDDNGQMNQDLSAIQGELLVISQFTLIASTKKGNRPSFNAAADPAKGEDYYRRVVAALEETTSKSVKTGVFAADMQVSLVNDGPVTITFDSKNRE